MSRSFMEKAESMGTLGICDAATLPKGKRRGLVPQDVRVALKIGDEVFEAQPGEKLHAQMFCRLVDCERTGPAIRDALKAGEYQAGFTVETCNHCYHEEQDWGPFHVGPKYLRCCKCREVA